MKLYVQQYRPSVWQQFLGIWGLLCFVASVVVIVAPGLSRYYDSDLFMYAIVGIFPSLVFASAFLPVKLLVIDLKKRTLHYERKFLFIRIAMPKKPLPQIEYISAFYQLVSNGSYEEDIEYSYIYDVNAWYGNNHLKLSSHYTADDALRSARKIAFALNCDLLDATDPENKVWVEMPGAKTEA